MTSQPLLDTVRLEKAAADHGFDLTPVMDGEWVSFGSSQLSERVWLKATNGDQFILAVTDGRILSELKRDAAINDAAQQGPGGSAGAVQLIGYGHLYNALARVSALARSLPTLVAERFKRATAGMPQSTEVERLVVLRVGQQLFRDALIDYWGGRCAVTGLTIVPLLRASHIKPWAQCASDDERLDVFNGLLLAPHLDALFDGGWIGFSQDGAIILSQQLDEVSREMLNVRAELRMAWVAPEHQSYMTHHRANVFRA